MVLSKLTSHLFDFIAMLGHLLKQLKQKFKSLIRKNYVVNKVKK